MDRILVSDLLIEKLGTRRIKELVEKNVEEEVHLTSGLRLKVFGERSPGQLKVQIWENSCLVETKYMTLFLDFGIPDYLGRNYKPHMH